MKADFDISGNVAVITGGAGVLCAEMARGLADRGARIALLDLMEDKAQEVAQAIVRDGGEVIAVGCDVLDRRSMESAAKSVLARYGTVDILINGAGGNKAEATTGAGKSFFDMPGEAIKWVFDLNLMGTILPTQVFGRVFAEKKKGCVVNISSMAAFTPLTRTVAYSAAKAGVSNFTQWMAAHFNQEYSPHIRVNAIAPGFLLTQQNEYLLMDRETGRPTERGAKIIAGTPMGRYGKPEELVGAVIFLCSPAASFVNGAVLPVDGGYAAYSGV
jgi:NAD(P)-dependent dehydrogenase (short-subunit alcohol dehydrogenase family)